MKCTYKKEFPVDEFGRPGALYSLADLPVAGIKVPKELDVVRVK